MGFQTNGIQFSGPLPASIVQSCDASLLLDSTRRMMYEKEMDRSFGLRNFRYLDSIKEAVERECPGVVSCADILVLSATDGIVAERGNGSCTCTQTTRCAKDRVENPQAIAEFLMSFFPEKTMLLAWDVLSELVESTRTPYLFLCSEDDDLAPVQTICNFAQRI